MATDRVYRFEYLALFGSLILVLLETIIHLITWCLRELTKQSLNNSKLTPSQQVLSSDSAMISPRHSLTF
jgi:flagellar biogenesis protein FliO